MKWRMFVELSEPDALGNKGQTTQFENEHEDPINAAVEALVHMIALKQTLPEGVTLVSFELRPALLPEQFGAGG